MVGDVRDRPVAVGDPVAECAAALVRHVERAHVEAFDLMAAGLHALEPPVPAQPVGTDGKVRRAHREREHVGRFARPSVGPGLVRHVDDDVRIVAISGREEREALHVVPMQVREQQRSLERPAVEQVGDSPDSRARVEHQRERLTVVGQRDARRVPAGANELGTGCGRRAANTAEQQPHEGPVSAR